MRGILEDLRDKPQMRASDFLKVDYNSSPRYKYSPVKAVEHGKIRFIEGDVQKPLRRSFVGTSQQYSDYLDGLKKKDEKPMESKKKVCMRYKKKRTPGIKKSSPSTVKLNLEGTHRS